MLLHSHRLVTLLIMVTVDYSSLLIPIYYYSESTVRKMSIVLFCTRAKYFILGTFFPNKICPWFSYTCRFCSSDTLQPTKKKPQQIPPCTQRFGFWYQNRRSVPWTRRVEPFLSCSVPKQIEPSKYDRRGRPPRTTGTTLARFPRHTTERCTDNVLGMAVKITDVCLKQNK